jgi:two-component system KDP operon response regulator KdpE
MLAVGENPREFNGDSLRRSFAGSCGRDRRPVAVPRNHQRDHRRARAHLSPKEFELLVFFIRNPGKVLMHRKLLAKVWGGNYTDQTEYLRVFVRHLRKKIELDPAKPRYILTDPWVGYRFQSGE